MTADGAPPRLILLDANVLLLLFVGLFDRQLIPKFKRTKQFSGEDYDLLVEVVTNFQHIVTTPHILTEVSNLSGQLVDEHRDRFFTLLATQLRLLDERALESATIVTEQIFVRLGLTDAWISRLAHERSVVVLTVDSPLYVHLLERRVRAFNFNHLRSIRWNLSDY